MILIKNSLLRYGKELLRWFFENNLMLSLLVCKFCLKLIGKIVGLAHLVFFNYLEMDSETKTFEKATMSTEQTKNVSDDNASSTENASSNEKATSLTAPIGIYIFVFFVEMKCFFVSI